MSEVLGFTYASFDEILALADIISLHVPGTGATHHLINRNSIKKMKPGMTVINTSRRTVIDTEALLWGLEEGIIRGWLRNSCPSPRAQKLGPYRIADPTRCQW